MEQLPSGSVNRAGSASKRLDSLSTGAPASAVEECCSLSVSSECSTLLEPGVFGVMCDVGEQSGEYSSTVHPVVSMSSDRRPNPGKEWHGAKSSTTYLKGGMDESETESESCLDRCVALINLDK